MTREDRALEMRNRALDIVKACVASPTKPEMRECTISGMTIRYDLLGDARLLTVGTKAGKVLSIEWENSGKFRVLSYIPGLWETRLRHLTQRRT